MSENPSGTPATPSSTSASTASSTPSGGSTPSSSTPSASPSAAASLERATAAAANAGSSPAAPGTPAGGASVPASTPPATGGAAEAPVSGQPAQGPIPFDRHQAAIRNARQEARQELEQELGWARTIGDRQRIERAITILDRLERDPNGFHQQLGSELTPAQAQALEELNDPEPDLRDMTGNPITYSAKSVKALVKNEVERARRELLAEINPLRETSDEWRQAQQTQAVQAQARQTATEVLTELRQNPEFKKHEPEVLRLYQQMEPVRQKYGAVATLQMAWNRFYHETIVPTLTHRQEQQTLTDLQRSAAAGTPGAVTPPAPTPSKPKIRDGNVDDIAAHMEALAGAATVT